MEPTGPTQQPMARTPFWTRWWRVQTTILTLCRTWATTLIHCQTLATPKTWWTATSWPGLTPTCRIGKSDSHSKGSIDAPIARHWLFFVFFSCCSCILINLHCDWPVLFEWALWLAWRVVEGKERNKGSWKVPDTRKQRRWLPQEC